MRYLLDTNILSDLIHNPKGGLAIAFERSARRLSAQALLLQRNCDLAPPRMVRHAWAPKLTRCLGHRCVGFRLARRCCLLPRAGAWRCCLTSPSTQEFTAVAARGAVRLAWFGVLEHALRVLRVLHQASISGSFWRMTSVLIS